MAGDIDFPVEHDEGDVIHARIAGAKIVDGKIVGGRIIHIFESGARQARHAATQLAERDHRDAEIVALLGLCVVILAIALL